MNPLTMVKVGDPIRLSVESQAQADVLRELGCTYGQGFLFGRPIDQTSGAQALGLRVSSRCLQDPCRARLAPAVAEQGDIPVTR